MRAPSKRAQEILDYAKKLGFSAEITRKNHLKFTRPGCRAVFASGTPGDRKVFQKTKSKLHNALREA